jgi:hypothetical protein
MEALEPRLFLSATIEESAFDGDFGGWFNTATVVELNPGASTTASGEIESYRDYDFLKFVATESGGMQITMAAGQDSSVDPLLYAFNSYRQAVAVNNNASRETTDAQVTFQVQAGQTYYLAALGLRSFGAYTLSFQTSIDEQGNTFADAQEVAIIAGQTTTITSSINYANDRDYVKFVAPVSGGLSVEMIGAGQVDPFVVGYDQYHRVMGWNLDVSNGSTDAAFSMVVQAGQTYYIWAGGWRATAGDYELLLSITEDEYGNTFADAGEVSITAGQTTTITSSIVYANDRDYVKFVAPVSGGLSVEMTGAEVDPLIVGYNQNHRVMAWDIGASDAAFSMEVQAGQTYYIWVGGWRATAGDYELSLSISEDEQGNTFADAEETTVVAGQSTTITSSINYANDRDYVKFVAPVSGGLTVEMDGGDQVDPLIVGYDQNHRVMAWDIDASDATFTMEVQAGQTYYIRIVGVRATAGDYSLSLSITEDQFGSNFGQAGVVALDENGAATVNSVYDYRYDFDVMRIVATHSEEITIDLAITSDDVVVPLMLVYNQAGRFVTYATSRSGESISVAFEAQAGQTYYLKTYNRNPNTTGAYELDITTDVPPEPDPDPEPDPEPIPEPEPDPDPDPEIVPGQTVTASVVIDGASRILRVLGTDGIDLISLSQSGISITLDIAGALSTFTDNFTSVLVYGFGSADTIRTTYSLSVDTTIYAGDGNDKIYENAAASAVVYGESGDDLIVSIGGGVDTLHGGAGLDSFWYDSSDTVSDASAAESSAQSLHRVASFYQPWTDNSASGDYVSMSINGQDMRDPTYTSYASGYANFSDRALFVDGPQYNDIRQGAIGDCYYLASLASLADTDPQIISQMITSLGDGTYAMRYYRSGSEVYLRLDADLPVYSSGNLVYAKTGPDNEIWVPLAEKAYAHFRYGQNSYSSISGGWMTNVNREITGKSSAWRGTSGSTASLATYIRTQLNAGYGLTLGSYSGASSPVVGSHAYVIMSIDDSNYVTVYNPWGVDGRSYDSNYGDGLLRLSINQIQDNYSATVVALA